MLILHVISLLGEWMLVEFEVAWLTWAELRLMGVYEPPLNLHSLCGEQVS